MIAQSKVPVLVTCATKMSKRPVVVRVVVPKEALSAKLPVTNAPPAPSDAMS